MTIHNDTITGYKIFKKDFTCRDYDFKGVGAIHTYEDTPVLCRSGFHFCTTLEDCFKYYDITSDMIVCEVQATNYTDAKDDCSKRTCQTLTIICQMTIDEVKSHISTSKNAYYWARYIGDKEYMKQYVTDSRYAYWWAKHIGDTEHMKQFVTDSAYACFWARDIGDKEYMINKFPEIAKRLA